MFDPIIGIQKWFKSSTPQKKLVAALLVISLLATGIFLIMSGASGISTDPMSSAPLYLAGVFVKLIGVLLLIVASAVLFRRWMHLEPKGGAVRQLHLLETVRLSPKQTLYLVAVGDQQLLIGATDQNISLLSPVESSFSAAQAGESLPQKGLDFGSLVHSFNSDAPTAPQLNEQA
jgi:flagellar protein FliO/FliZ